MSRYRLAALARADLDEIWLFTARKAGIAIADRLIDSITSRFPVLARMPQAGRERNDIEPGVRSFAIRKYVIYYRKARKSGIVISRVIHGERDQKHAWETRDD